MAVTPVYRLPYPALSDSPNVPLHLQQLAQATEAALAPVDQRTEPGHLIASRTSDLPLTAGGWATLIFTKVDSAHGGATLAGGNPQLPAGWWMITIDAQIRIADGGAGYVSWAGGPFNGTNALTDGYAGPGVSRAVALAVPSQITARAKTSGKNGTLVFARFSAFRTTAPNPDPAAAYATPPAI
jgi:hypothetical protein